MMFVKSEHWELYNLDHIRKISVGLSYTGDGRPDGYAIYADGEKLRVFRDEDRMEAKRKAYRAMGLLEEAIEAGHKGSGDEACAVFRFPANI